MTDTVIMTSDQGACSVVLDGVSYAAAADGKFTIPTNQVADAKGHGLWPDGEARPAVVEPPKRHLPASLTELGHRLMGLQTQVDTLLELLSAHLSAGNKK